MIFVSEWVFWAEFESRFNFIAVDYLVYTNEVIGKYTGILLPINLVKFMFVASLILVIAISRLPFLNLWGHIPRKKALLALLIVQLLVNLAITARQKICENRYSQMNWQAVGCIHCFMHLITMNWNYRHFTRRKMTHQPTLLLFVNSWQRQMHIS